MCRFACVCMMGQLASLKNKCCSKKKEAIACIQGSSWETEKQPEATCLLATFAALLFVRMCVCSICVHGMCGYPICTSFTLCVCVCVQTCALISFYWNCCVILLDFNVGWSFSAPQLKVQPEISHMLQNTSCDGLEDQQEGTVYYLAVVHKG